MEKPILNQEEREYIISNTYYGAKLNFWLKLQILKRDTNIFEWKIYKWLLNRKIKKSIKFKGWD